MAHSIIRYYPEIPRDELRFILVHSQSRILPELTPELAAYAQGKLENRGIEFVMGARVAGATPDKVLLNDGSHLPTCTLVWTAGNQPHPVLKTLPGELDRRGAVVTDSALRVKGLNNVWAVGDCAVIPDVDSAGQPFPPTAQHALREGKVVAENITAVLRGKAPKPFRKLAHQFKGLFNIYVDNVAAGVHSLTGEHFSGLPFYEPAKDASGADLNQDENEFPFQLFTFKHIYGGQSRTVGNYWAQLGVSSENYVLMNKVDADQLGLKGGDLVKLVSPTNPDGMWRLPNGENRPVVGKVKPIQGIRPGTVAASWHFGHWAYGASDFVVDGQVVKGDPRRATGICPNAVMIEDPVLENASLTDPIGGSASFYDTRVKVVPA